MKKKPAKVGEAPAPYAPKKATASPRAKTEGTGTRYMDDAAFRKAADKVFRVHHELLRKLAQ